MSRRCTRAAAASSTAEMTDLCGQRQPEAWTVKVQRMKGVGRNGGDAEAVALRWGDMDLVEFIVFICFQLFV